MAREAFWLRPTPTTCTFFCFFAAVGSFAFASAAVTGTSAVTVSAVTIAAKEARRNIDARACSTTGSEARRRAKASVLPVLPTH
jgi:hypothetical protein